MTSIFAPTPIVIAVTTQFGIDLAGEISVDLFTGGGGMTIQNIVSVSGVARCAKESQ